MIPVKHSAKYDTGAQNVSDNRGAGFYKLFRDLLGIAVFW